ncbi:MAG: hypothetical protein WCP82_10770 [Alphaproteobacteria bacterium]
MDGFHEEGQHPPEHHPPGWVEKATGLGALVAIAGSLFAFLSWAFDLLPYAKAVDVAAVEKRVTSVEHGLTNLDIGQKETQELQLMDRVQALEDRLAKLPQTAADYADYRQQRLAAQQRLRQVQEQLAQARSRQ